MNIQIIPTPNPQSLKFKTSSPIATEHWEVALVEEAERSPIAKKILGFPWATKVFIGPDFITVNKEDWVEWDLLQDPLYQMIKEHIEAGQTILYPDDHFKNDSSKDGIKDIDNAPSKEIKTDDPVSLKKILSLLEKNVLPAVAMDGGFIAVKAYDKGVLYLQMQGACSGCPSSTITLKQGIEAHLKSHIRDLKEVVAI